MCLDQLITSSFASSAFFPFFFFFFLKPALVDLLTFLLFTNLYILLLSNFFPKIGSHCIIYIVFLVFGFQFSKISTIQTDPKYVFRSNLSRPHFVSSVFSLFFNPYLLTFS